MTRAAVAKDSKPAFRGIVGDKVAIIKLGTVEPNGWNPNKMTAFEYQSLKQGLADDGWLLSDSMLVWGKDDKGKPQNLIINGEHRHRAAVELGMKEGPAVILNGLTAAQAKALTIKLDSKRGSFDNAALAELVREIGVGIDPALLGLSLGFDDETLKELLEARPSIPPDEFRSVDVNAETTYCCPKCSYEWTGKPK